MRECRVGILCDQRFISAPVFIAVFKAGIVHQIDALQAGNDRTGTAAFLGSGRSLFCIRVYRINAYSVDIEHALAPCIDMEQDFTDPCRGYRDRQHELLPFPIGIVDLGFRPEVIVRKAVSLDLGAELQGARVLAAFDPCGEIERFAGVDGGLVRPPAGGLKQILLAGDLRTAVSCISFLGGNFKIAAPCVLVALKAVVANEIDALRIGAVEVGIIEVDVPHRPAGDGELDRVRGGAGRRFAVHAHTLPAGLGGGVRLHGCGGRVVALKVDRDLVRISGVGQVDPHAGGKRRIAVVSRGIDAVGVGLSLHARCDLIALCAAVRKGRVGIFRDQRFISAPVFIAVFKAGIVHQIDALQAGNDRTRSAVLIRGRLLCFCRDTDAGDYDAQGKKRSSGRSEHAFPVFHLSISFGYVIVAA